MRVKSKKTQVRTYAEMTVTSDVNGAIVLNGRMDNGECWHKALQPKDAVQVWRRMMGEIEDAMHIPSPHLYIRYNEHDGTWTFSDSEVLCVLDADECMLVAWAIEKAAGTALYNGPVNPIQDNHRKAEEKTSCVWILVSSSRPGPFSSNKEYCKSLGVNAMAFSSREEALDGLREFIREEVNKSHYETNWAKIDDRGRTADDIIDEIVKSGSGVWMYDGTARSFVVQLMKEEVVK